MKFRNIAVISVAATIGAVALGIGGAQAAGLLGSEGIKDNSIRSIDIKDQTLRTSDMSAAALQQLQGQKGDTGAEGPQGPQGNTGAEGPQGEPGNDGKDAVLDTYVVQAEFDVPAGDKADGNVWCNVGDRLLSGGYSSNDHNNHWSKIYQNRMTWSQAAQDAAVANGKAADAQPDGWYVQALGGDDASAIRLWAYCTVG